jgi:hypothetical protein
MSTAAAPGISISNSPPLFASSLQLIIFFCLCRLFFSSQVIIFHIITRSAFPLIKILSETSEFQSAPYVIASISQ